MKAWAKQIAGTALVLILALGVGGFVMILRAQQGGLAASMSAANIRAVSPPDGGTNVPLAGQIRADYIRRPAQDPAIRVEPPVGVRLDGGHWEGTTYVLNYLGLRENSLYHVELDQDDSPNTGEHKQIKVRWSFRTGSGQTIPTKPTATPTPTPTATVAVSATPSPPTSLPDMIWYSGQTGTGTGGLMGVDWNGNQVKTLRWVGTLQSPDGLRIYNAMTPSTDVFDTSGNLVGTVAGQGFGWADDSQRFCDVRRNPTGVYELVTMPLDGTVHHVATISLQATPSLTGQQLYVAACSPLTGRAIVIGASNGSIWSMTMISMTDGSVIYQTRYANPVNRLIASHDGSYVAEQLGTVNGKSRTVIRSLPSGQLVGDLAGVSVDGFSWDGSLVAGGLQGNTGLIGAEVLNWKTHAVVWSACGCPSPFDVRVIAQPGGSKIAVAAFDQRQIGSITIVDANGAATSLPLASRSFHPLF